MRTWSHLKQHNYFKNIWPIISIIQSKQFPCLQGASLTEPPLGSGHAGAGEVAGRRAARRTAVAAPM